MGGDWSDWHWGFGFGHWIFGVVFWLVILLLLFSLIRGVGFMGGRESPGERTALDILKDRYAKGEMDREEYERKRKDLER